jgi:hypothetical protein
MIEQGDGLLQGDSEEISRIVIAIQRVFYADLQAEVVGSLQMLRGVIQEMLR